jgi:hypothetical protein
MTQNVQVYKPFSSYFQQYKSYEQDSFNSIFYAKSTDGSWTLPTQDDKGVYHMKGEVRVTGRDTQMEH